MVKSQRDRRPTEETLKQMQASKPPASYLLGTQKGKLSALEKNLIMQPLQQARQGVQVKPLALVDKIYVLGPERQPCRQRTLHAAPKATPIPQGGPFQFAKSG